MTRVRTIIEIENAYVERIMDRYRVSTKTEAVDLALRHLACLPLSREEALNPRVAGGIVEAPDGRPPAGSCGPRPRLTAPA